MNKHLLPKPDLLSIADHRRDRIGLRYIYPVISRRANGVSLGINLNVNNACNWACIYCQVPDLSRGGPPPVDLRLLENELRQFLEWVVHGDYLQRHAPSDAQQLMDIAFSGNGEPTTAPEFDQCVELVIRTMQDFSLLGSIPLRLISNGSQMHRKPVCDGVARMGRLDQPGGEVWFKLDSATAKGMQTINGIPRNIESVRRNLLRCAELAPTWLQTCFFHIDGIVDHSEQNAYLEFVESIRQSIVGVRLYGIARPSMQSGAQRLSPASETEIKKYAERIAALGVSVRLNP